MAVQKGLRRLPRIGLHESDIGLGQDQAEEGNLFPLPPQLHHRLAEVDLGLARRVMQRHESLARRLPPGPDIVLHDADCSLTRGLAVKLSVSVRQPRVRDRGDGAIRFTSAILPRYLRGIVKLIECRLFSAFLHEAKLLNLRGGAIDNVPRFRSESG